MPAGPSETLTGNNTVYRRALLDRYRAEIEAGRFEEHLHGALRRDGITLFCRPEIEVAHKKHDTVGGYLAQRYLYSRSYAACAIGRGVVAGPPRLCRGCLRPSAAAVVPDCVTGARHPALPRELAKSLPLLAVFVVGWAAGEMVGALAGPGNALSRVS